ncbi:hypothetical protein DFJ73DRAFT_900592 [Zopfochytrium polystomum]|nr:hypothetical protein DFJ73DRAFT_900592 [Zopfochytrium polystomum]
MVDVLRMDLAELDSWDWANPVPWGFCNKPAACVHLPHHAMCEEDRQRRHAFLAIKASNLVSDVRRAAFRDQYSLPESTSDTGEWSEYNDTKSAEGRSGSGPAARQSLLRLLTTEMLLHRKLYGEFMVLASDFKTFGRRCHTRSYRRSDGGAGKIRRLGLPSGRTLLDAMGEAVLFCLDFAMHAQTDGAALYRFHDDVVLWDDGDMRSVVGGAIREFAAVMRLELNAKKTRSARIDGARGSAPSALADNDALPKGPVRWEFLVLDELEGVWNVDQ